MRIIICKGIGMEKFNENIVDFSLYRLSHVRPSECLKG